MVQNPRESVHKHCAHPRGNEITRTQLSASHDRTRPGPMKILLLQAFMGACKHTSTLAARTSSDTNDRTVWAIGYFGSFIHVFWITCKPSMVAAGYSAVEVILHRASPASRSRGQRGAHARVRRVLPGFKGANLNLKITFLALPLALALALASACGCNCAKNVFFRYSRGGRGTRRRQRCGRRPQLLSHVFSLFSNAYPDDRWKRIAD